MCGRYAITTDPEVLAALLGLAEVQRFDVRYNLAPTQTAPIARLREDGALALDPLRWGLVPSWAKELAIGARMINARSETVAEKPAFRSAFKHRRCVVPASWFYEWRREGKEKIPHRIERVDGETLTLAGLWESWKGRGDVPGCETFTILTTAANGDLEELHDRMPVILPDAAARERWLATPPDEAASLADLMAPAADSLLRHFAVSTRVNNVRNEGPSILGDDSSQTGLFGD